MITLHECYIMIDMKKAPPVLECNRLQSKQQLGAAGLHCTVAEGKSSRQDIYIINVCVSVFDRSWSNIITTVLNRLFAASSLRRINSAVPILLLKRKPLY